MAQKAEKIIPKIIYKWLYNVQLSPRGQKWQFFSQPESSKYWVKRFGSDNLIHIRIKSRFWISVSGWKLTILPDIQPTKRRVSLLPSVVLGIEWMGARMKVTRGVVIDIPPMHRHTIFLWLKTGTLQNEP